MKRDRYFDVSDWDGPAEVSVLYPWFCGWPYNSWAEDRFAKVMYDGLGDFTVQAPGWVQCYDRFCFERMCRLLAAEPRC